MISFISPYQTQTFRAVIKFYAVAIRTAPVWRLVFAIRTGVRGFHGISL